METTIELVLELVGGLILLFAAVWLFVRFTSYGEYYDNMLYDDDGEIDIIIKRNENKDNDEDSIIHSISFRN